jgi:UDP-glucuronate 4-epimerase
MKRDFTYVDDIIEGIFRLVPHIPKPRKNDDSLDMTDPSISFAPYRVFNIGNNNPVDLMHFIEVLESNLGKKAEKNYLPLQDGDVPATFADVDPLMKEVGFKPSTSVEEGIRAFVEWYTAYYDI